MTAYYAILDNAVSGLPDRSLRARRGVYDRARSALVERLRQMEPPVAEEYIVRESIALNEAIIRLEASLAAREAVAAATQALTIEMPVMRLTEAPPVAPPPEVKPPPVPPPEVKPPPVPPPEVTPPPVPPPKAKPRAVAPPPVPPPEAKPQAMPPPMPPPVAPPPPEVKPPPVTPPEVKPQAVVPPPEVKPPPEAKPPPVTPPEVKPQAVPSPPEAKPPPVTPPEVKPPPVPPLEVTPQAVTPPEVKPADPPSRPDGVAVSPPTRRRPVLAPAASLSEAPAANPLAGVPPGRGADRIKAAGSASPLRPAARTVPLGVAVSVAAVMAFGVGIAAWSLRGQPGPAVPVRAAQPAALKSAHRADERDDAADPTSDTTDAEAEAGDRPAVPVGQRAALLLDAPDEPRRIKVYVGAVNWRTETRAIGSTQAPALTAVADVVFPDAKLKMTMFMQTNREVQLSASHKIELRFAPEPASPLGDIKAVGTLAMRHDDDTRLGVPLTGITVPVSENDFLVGLSRGGSEAENMRLVSENAWFDLPVLFASDTVGKVTFEKGESGQKMWDAGATGRP